ncbi:MAG: cysteine peptidase family C39 domain-containing protein [Alphaproteobacteria bacterium]|nr:cysteine peptidase family C39 domain-containing protein [Alphaproteobacteria bacterium]
MRDQPELSDAATASGDGPDRDPTFGYAALSLLMALAGRSVSVDQLAHDGGGRAADAATLVRAARHRGWQAKVKRAKPAELAGLPLPLLARMVDGTFRVLARASADRVLVQNPVSGAPETVSLEDWARLATGEVVQLGAPVEPDAPTIGFAWFLPVLRKYAGALGQVALASSLLQVFGIATPLFVMVVIDRVLTTGGLSTLEAV